jgi:hypothetical protein
LPHIISREEEYVTEGNWFPMEKEVLFDDKNYQESRKEMDS